MSLWTMMLVWLSLIRGFEKEKTGYEINGFSLTLGKDSFRKILKNMNNMVLPDVLILGNLFAYLSKWLIRYLGGAGLILLLGCSKIDPEIEMVMAGKCYAGNIIGGTCPSTVFVEVTNANIGEDWTVNDKMSGEKTYSHVVAIHNYPQNLLPEDNKIYFTAKVGSTYSEDNCSNSSAPCSTVVISVPETSICVESISTINCDAL